MSGPICWRASWEPRLGLRKASLVPGWEESTGDIGGKSAITPLFRLDLNSADSVAQLSMIALG